MCVSDNPILVSFHIKLSLPNPLCFCNCIVGYYTDGVHFLSPLALLHLRISTPICATVPFSVAAWGLPCNAGFTQGDFGDTTAYVVVEPMMPR